LPHPCRSRFWSDRVGFKLNRMLPRFPDLTGGPLKPGFGLSGDFANNRKGSRCSQHRFFNRLTNDPNAIPVSRDRPRNRDQSVGATPRTAIRGITHRFAITAQMGFRKVDKGRFPHR
jgi:hypothetical protein